MTSTEDAREVAERYATAWTNDDLDGILGCYSDEFTLHYFGDNPFSGTHRGKDASLAVLLEVGARAPWKLLAIEEILAGPSTAVIVAKLEITVDGTTVDSTTVDGTTVEIRRVLRFRIANGQFTDCWLYEENQALIDRAWAE